MFKVTMTDSIMSFFGSILANKRNLDFSFTSILPIQSEEYYKTYGAIDYLYSLFVVLPIYSCSDS